MGDDHGSDGVTWEWSSIGAYHYLLGHQGLSSVSFNERTARWVGVVGSIGDNELKHFNTLEEAKAWVTAVARLQQPPTS